MNETEKNSLLLHTDCISVFQEEYFKKVLNVEHIVSEGAVNFPKVKQTDGEDLEINFFGWVVLKDGVSWLIPNTDKDGGPISIKDIFPLVPNKFEEVGFNNKAYRLVDKYSIVKYKSENRLGMKKLVDLLTAIPHTNNKHRKLLIMSVLAQVFSRAYFRFSSPPGFGKDSIVDTLGLLIGGCATIENPSRAKLELEASIRKLTGLNEVVGLSRSQWMDISKFILSVCAHKPSVNKQTRAFGGVGEIISLKNFSMSLFYNDIDCYSDPKTIYFDDLAESGIRDRLPALRFNGSFTYDWNKVSEIRDINKFVKDNWEKYLDIIYTISYYKDNISLSLKYESLLPKMSNRERRSLGTLLAVVQEYVTTEEEFKEWISIIEDSMLDYRVMNEYKGLLKVVNKQKFKTDFDKLWYLLSDCTTNYKKLGLDEAYNYLKRNISNPRLLEFSKELIKSDTFIEKVKTINNELVSDKKPKSDSKDIRGYW